MAAPLNHLCRSLANGAKLSGLLWNQNVRNASKKAGGSTKNVRGRGKNQHRGLKKREGDYVEKGMILHKQLGLECYPGQSVGVGRDLTLFALEPGYVMVSKEEVSPRPDSPLYAAVKAGRVFVKTFYHVLPEKQLPKFKLVSQV